MIDRTKKAASRPLRCGWTTGACATAGAKAAYHALLCGDFPDPAEILLLRGEKPSFALARHERGAGWCYATIVKDAGDDPDVTHGVLVGVRVHELSPGAGVCFVAGEGVGTVTLPGLPIEPGEPAINPVPRKMMKAAIAEVADLLGGSGDVEIEISIADGARFAQKTANPRLGILGDLSVLGTTGIVRPSSVRSGSPPSSAALMSRAQADSIISPDARGRRRKLRCARFTGFRKPRCSTWAISRAA